MGLLFTTSNLSVALFLPRSATRVPKTRKNIGFKNDGGEKQSAQHVDQSLENKIIRSEFNLDLLFSLFIPLSSVHIYSEILIKISKHLI